MPSSDGLMVSALLSPFGRVPESLGVCLIHCGCALPGSGLWVEPGAGYSEL